jgi:hypothetical protein
MEYVEQATNNNNNNNKNKKEDSRDKETTPPGSNAMTNADTNLKDTEKGAEDNRPYRNKEKTEESNEMIQEGDNKKNNEAWIDVKSTTKARVRKETEKKTSKKDKRSKFEEPVEVKLKELRQVKITGSRNRYHTYFDVTIKSLPHKKPFDKFMKTIAILMKNIWTLDPKATWHPFRDTSRHIKSIKKIDTLPKDMFTSSLYFRGISGIRATSFMVYTTILIGHKIDPNNIAEPIQKWAVSERNYFSERNVEARFASPASTTGH